MNKNILFVLCIIFLFGIFTEFLALFTWEITQQQNYGLTCESSMWREIVCYFYNTPSLVFFIPVFTFSPLVIYIIYCKIFKL